MIVIITSTSTSTSTGTGTGTGTSTILVIIVLSCIAIRLPAAEGETAAEQPNRPTGDISYSPQLNRMPNYQEGKVYKIYNAINDDIYVAQHNSYVKE